MTVPIGADVFRKYEIEGVPASGPHPPNKAEIAALLTYYESLLNGSAAGIVYTTRVALFADLAHAAHTSAIVVGDSTGGNNGLYVKNGASGAGSWSRVSDLMTSLVRFTVTGGTGNAIVATAPETPTVPGSKLYLLTPTANNSGATTIAINGGSAVAIKTALGSALVTGSLINGSQVLMAWQTDHYQLLISVPVDATGILNDALQAVTDATTQATAAASSASALGNQVHQYDTRALAAAATIPTGVKAIKVTRYATGYPLAYATYIPGTNTGPMNFAEAGGHYWELDLTGDIVEAAWFGVKADGIASDASALQAAITAAAGKEVLLPLGTIKLTSQVTYITTGSGTGSLNPGLRLRGAGTMKTKIDNQVASNSCLYIGQNDGLGFQFGGYIKGFSIMTTSAQTASHGIEHRACYQYLVEDVWVTGLTGDAMRVTCSVGDADAANTMVYSRCRFENCDIGLNCNFSSGILQPSFMTTLNCVWSGNRIGWRYIGLTGYCLAGVFVINSGIGLQFVNNSGSNAQFTGINICFENNLKSIDLNSMQGATFIQTELACGSAFAAQTVAVSMANCQNVEFTGTRVRINNTPHTLWSFGAGAVCNKIRNTFYQNYDNAGQTRYVLDPTALGNMLDDSFASVQIGAANGVSSVSCVNGTNNDVALPLDGTAYAISGITGAFAITGFTHGFDGRQLILKNNTGQIGTIKSETGSSAANQIRTEGGADVALNNQGCARFYYDGGDNRWHFLGKG